MSEDIRSLILDLVEWVALRPRSYPEVMDAWRTSCPRLPIWEDAVDDGYLMREWRGEAGEWVEVTAKGHALLAGSGRVGFGNEGHQIEGTPLNG